MAISAPGSDLNRLTGLFSKNSCVTADCSSVSIRIIFASDRSETRAGPLKLDDWAENTHPSSSDRLSKLPVGSAVIRE
jgi:hypothetical protein